MEMVTSGSNLMSTLLNEVLSSEISTIQNTVMQIVRIINDPNTSAKDLREIIEVDPPLSAKLLKLSNSAYYGYAKEIHGIQEAIVCIGFDAVRELALNQKVCKVFQDTEDIYGYKRTALWKHSVAVAVCAKLIYIKIFLQRGDSLYVAGLLHDLGIIALDQFLPNYFKKIVEKSVNERKCPFKIEREILRFTHSDIGGAIADAWGFPDDLIAAIAYHHNPGGAAREYQKITATLFVSEYSVQRENIGYCENPYERDHIFKQCKRALGIKDGQLEAVIKEVKEDISRMEHSNMF